MLPSCRVTKVVPIYCCAGVNQYDTEQPPRYVSSTNLSSRVGGLNPRWNEDASPELTQQRFLKAMDLTGGEFLESVEYFAKCWLPAREIVRKALEQRHEVRQS